MRPVAPNRQSLQRASPAQAPSPTKPKPPHEGTDAFRAWFNSDEGKECRATGDLTPEVLAECKIIASGADNLAPRLADDPFEADTSTASDDEIQRQIAEDFAREMARLEG